MPRYRSSKGPSGGGIVYRAGDAETKTFCRYVITDTTVNLELHKNVFEELSKCGETLPSILNYYSRLAGI